MKKTVLALAIAAAIAPSLAMAEAGDIVVRLRAAGIVADEDSSLGKYTNRVTQQLLGVNGVNPGAELTVDSNVIPEVDFSYYITKNIAAELILAVGTRHDVNITKSAGAAIGNQNLTDVNILPPTLTAQWHFMPDQTFDPYVGAGINYTIGMDRSLHTKSGFGAPIPIRIDRNMWGPAIQAGFDVNLKDGWLLNADVKKIWLSTDVEAKLAGKWRKIDDLDIDPWVIGIGVGKKF